MVNCARCCGMWLVLQDVMVWSMHVSVCCWAGLGSFKR